MQKLIDANNYKEALKALPDIAGKRASIELLKMMPTINLEDLPIVRQLREELDRVTAEKNAAVKQLSELECCEFCKHTGCIPHGGCGKCEWEWRGPQKEE